MPKPIRVSGGVIVPGAALAWRAVRSSGPGGQNVNKVASKVELRVDLRRILGLAADARERLESLAQSRLDAQGCLLLTSQRSRDQSRNLEDAREKVRALVARALVAPVPRRKTAPTGASVNRRIDEKKSTSSRKRARGRVSSADD